MDTSLKVIAREELVTERNSFLLATWPTSWITAENNNAKTSSGEIQDEISPIYQDPSSSKQDSIYQQIEELKKENNELREQIQLFKDLTKQVQITDNIYAIGEKASDFADHLKDLTKRLSTIDNNMHFV